MSDTLISKSWLTLLRGDITAQQADAIVNAANSGLRGGGGVDGAIHRAGGPSIMAECRRIGYCPTGDAVVTSAGALKARFVIHAVAPIYADGQRDEARLLRSAYQRSLECAAERGLRSIVFPALGTGIYGYPMNEAAEIALETVITHLRSVTPLERVVFALFDDQALLTHERVLQVLLAR